MTLRDSSAGWFQGLVVSARPTMKSFNTLHSFFHDWCTISGATIRDEGISGP